MHPAPTYIFTQYIASKASARHRRGYQYARGWSRLAGNCLHQGLEGQLRVPASGKVIYHFNWRDVVYILFYSSLWILHVQYDWMCLPGSFHGGDLWLHRHPKHSMPKAQEGRVAKICTLSLDQKIENGACLDPTLHHQGRVEQEYQEH